MKPEDKERPSDAAANSPRRKRVGDVTPNPLPTIPIAVEQPPGDDNPANAEGDNPVD